MPGDCKRWTEAENDVLRTHYLARGGAWCAEKLGRTRPAVVMQARKLLRPHWATPEMVAEIVEKMRRGL